MPDFSPAAQALHVALAQRLATAGCQRGRFDVSEPGASLSLSGQKPAGNTVFFWKFDRIFKQLVNTFLAENHADDNAQLTILIDVAAGTFRHERTSRQQVATEQRADELRAIAHRRSAPRDRTPYGPVLAAQVADCLDRGARLAYSHRDYCGLGLIRVADGSYHYGGVYDGDFATPDQVFANRAGFERWLAAQSDHSLAGLESPDPWVWDNQRLTRRRLLDFTQSRPMR